MLQQAGTVSLIETIRQKEAQHAECESLLWTLLKIFAQCRDASEGV